MTCRLVLFRPLRWCLLAVAPAFVPLPVSAQLSVLSVPADTNMVLPGSMSMAWNPTASPEATGYYVEYGFSRGDHPNRLELGNTTSVTIGGMQTNVCYYLTVVAHDAAGNESPPSNEIEILLPGPVESTNASMPLSATLQPDGVLRLSVPSSAGDNWEIQATEDLQDWVTIGTTNCVADGPIIFDVSDMAQHPRRFYRALKSP